MGERSLQYVRVINPSFLVVVEWKTPRAQKTLQWIFFKFFSRFRRTKRKWQSREERKIDREYDVVLVPSDAGCVSGSESDDSDWSIGWLEPHGPEFQSDDELDGSFAVLVPCYGRGRNDVVEDANKKIFSTIGNIPDGYSAENGKYMEQWLSSLQRS
ncbi:unnamed protein product, partial [Vitis vinifera]